MTVPQPAQRIPGGLKHYKSTPLFTAQTTPAALQGDHSTKPGVWGAIQVRTGRLRYVVTDGRRKTSTVELTPEGPAGVVEPTILHRVELIGDVEF
jgi:tellurite resistance-related uncharacterized protein